MTRALAALLALLVVPAYADERAEPDLRRLFPEQAPVFVPSPGGLCRLRVPPEILAACRPDLSDVRLFDGSGREIPYVIDAGPDARTRVEVKETAEATILDVKREEIRREDGPPRHRETYTLEVPGTTPAAGAWSLAFRSARPHFVRRLDVTTVLPDGSTRPVVENGSLFRLPNVAKDKTSVALPSLAGARLTVGLEGEDGGYLEPRLVFEGSRFLDPREEAVVPLAELARRRTDGRTILELARPRGLVPDVLRVATATGVFDRPVEVWDVRPGGNNVLLGRGNLFRLEAIAPVGENELTLGPARGDRLRVEVVDGDSGPLDALAFAAVVRQPSLVFSLASDAGEEPAGALYFGGGRAYAPRYDLARLFPAPGEALAGERASAAARLRDPSGALAARLGGVGPNPLFDGAPALAFAMQPGAEVDTRLYAKRRALAVRPSSEGLSVLRLRAEDVAHARPDLADVRVVDADRRQWPYLLEPDAAEEWQPLEVTSPLRRERTSRYRLGLPVSPVRSDQIVLDTDASFFDRAFRLIATVEGEREITLAQGRLVQRVGKPRPVTIDFAPARVVALELVVQDGDDSPLVFRAVRARLRLPELYLAAPAGDYFLLVGDPRASAPSYELSRVRDVVLAVSSAPVEAKASGPNPDYSVRGRLGAERRGDLVPQVLLWSVLIAAVVVLTALTLRLARAGGDAPPPSA